MLQRWVSADPLTIHGLGADLNAYAYVSGKALKAIDPLGLEEVTPDPTTLSTTSVPVEGPGDLSVKAGDVTVLADVTIEGTVPEPQVTRTVGFGGPVGAGATAVANAGVGAAAFFAGVGDMASGEAPIYHDPENAIGPLLGATAQNFEEWKFTPMELDDPTSQFVYGFTNRAAAVAPAFGRGNTGLLLAEGEGAAKAGGSLSTPQAYSVAFEATLQKKGIGTYPSHFAEANTQLLQGMVDPDFAMAMRATLGQNFEGTILSSSGRVTGSSPSGWTWHHVPDQPGVLQLVPRPQHAPGSAWQGLLHPGGQGGMARWGHEF